MELDIARERFEAASRNLRTRASLQKDEASVALWEAYENAQRELLTAERQAADAGGQEYAVEWQGAGEWPQMAQGPAVLVGSFVCVLTFDGTAGAVQVVFQHPEAIRFSCVSDEVITGHPLYGKGLRAYRRFLVMNSAWLAELQKCDAVHPQHDPCRWECAKHYLLCFKDRMFEVIATREPIWKSFATKAEALREALALCERIP